MSKLVIISGGEATGKSTIRDELAQRLKVGYLSKDIIKEKMFDKHPVSTWRYSWYETTAKRELFKEVKQHLERSQSIIIETNFKSKDLLWLDKTLKPNIEVYEIYCFSRGFVSFKRFVKRNESGLRHKGHHDRRWYPKILIYAIFQALGINWPYRPLLLSEKVIKLDTTDLSKIDYEAIIKFISQPT